MAWRGVKVSICVTCISTTLYYDRLLLLLLLLFDIQHLFSLFSSNSTLNIPNVCKMRYTTQPSVDRVYLLSYDLRIELSRLVFVYHAAYAKVYLHIRVSKAAT